MGEERFRLLPELSAENEFFWTSGADGDLRILRCQSCRYYVHPPSPICPECMSRDLAAERVSGRGVVHSFTVNHQAWDGDPEPYVIGLVALDEQDGLRLTTNLVECDPESVLIGMPVEVVFEDRSPVFVPLFRPVSG